MSETIQAGSAWARKHVAAASSCDFRSDVVTTPTVQMLQAIAQSSLLDDVYEEDQQTLELQDLMAKLTGKEAALLVVSGTMGNQVSLRTHLQGPPHAIICDRRGHIVQYEAGGPACLSSALIITIKPENGRYITLEEIQENAVIDNDVHHCPTRVIALENTLDGCIIPLNECRHISTWARENGLILHLDGARLWEAVTAGAGSLAEYCECFDSVSICFSKGLGAPIGSIIVGNRSFIDRARWIRKFLGGGLRQSGVVSSAARIAVEQTFMNGELAKVHERAKRVGRVWEELGGKLELPVETNMVWLDLKSISVTDEMIAEVARKHGLKINDQRIVFHYQIDDEAEKKLELVFRELLATSNVNHCQPFNLRVSCI